MDKLQYLTEMMGSEEKAKAFLQKTGQLQADLQAAGLTSKEKTPDAPAAQPPAPETPPAAPPAAIPSMDSIVERIRKEFDMDGLNELLAKFREDHDKVEVLEGLVQNLQKGDDEKIAEQLTPPAMRFVWTRANRPSQAEGTKLKKEAEEDDLLSKANPNVHWLSEVTGTPPVRE